ncbi:MAG: ATP-grasp domain-containing protein [Pseudomonadota bacterium]
MKIAVVYNRDSKSVINLFGIPNREKYGKKSIQRIVDGLKQHGHQVKSLEGDKDLIKNLEEFMPRVVKGEIPGMVFNLSYGIQGQARYTHVPGILEMVGIPYVGSGPLAHSLSLDKVVAKILFKQHGLPTPDFAVLDAPGFEAPDLAYPIIVKPKNEAVSMGIRIVGSEKELREAAQSIFDVFDQPVLAEQYIEGREINVGLIGNNPPEAFPPCEIVFGETGPKIYTIEDKKGQSGRKIQWLCPAPLEGELAERAREIAKKAFAALGCFDCARVDMRLDAHGNLHILEINSLPSLGEHGSYTIAAAQVGLDFPGLIGRLVEVASARYFGTPEPPSVDMKERDPAKLIFSFLTQRRDMIERRLKEWTAMSSRTSDPVGNNMALEKLAKRFKELNMKPVDDLTDGKSAWTWQTSAGLEGGTLFIGHIDVPLGLDAQSQAFRREPEWLYGEGIGTSRAPLVMLDFALRSLRHCRMLRGRRIGVLYYVDEGRDCRYSAELIRRACARAGRVIVLQPGSGENLIIIQRRGLRKYRLVIEGRTRRLGQHKKSPDVLAWTMERLNAIAGLSSRKERIALSAVDLKVDAFPTLLPHRVTVNLHVGYLDVKAADGAEESVRRLLGKNGIRWKLEKISDRPAMKERRASSALIRELAAVARKWDIPLTRDSSVMPSAGGLVPPKTAVLCGIGPVARDLYTPGEAVNRISLIQRTLLLAQFLAGGEERE